MRHVSSGRLFLLVAVGAFCASGSALAEAVPNDPAICEEAAERFSTMENKSALSEDKTVILLYKSQFCPQLLTVRQGASLRWINIENRTSHSVWFKDDGRPETDRIFPGEVIDMQIDLAPGEHRYLCGPHWESGMTGTLVVE